MSNLLVGDGNDDEAIGENTHEGMDDKLVGVVPQTDFSTVVQTWMHPSWRIC